MSLFCEIQEPTVAKVGVWDHRTKARILSHINAMVSLQDLTHACDKSVSATMLNAYFEVLNQLLSELEQFPEQKREEYLRFSLEYVKPSSETRINDYLVDVVDDILNRLRYGGWTSIYEYTRAERWDEEEDDRRELVRGDIPMGELPDPQIRREYEEWAAVAADHISPCGQLPMGQYKTQNKEDKEVKTKEESSSNNEDDEDEDDEDQEQRDLRRIEEMIDNYEEHWR
jgi:hypothetical protein